MRKFTRAIEETTRLWLAQDPFFEIYALGADYPNGVDGTHGNLALEFPGRLRDVPASESTFTGLALGRALSGKRTLVHHGRAEFALFAADQIFTQAAKWRYQFGGAPDVPLTIRVAVGRQWGNGPQHTASYLQLFSSVPGLRCVIPSSPNMAASLLNLAIASLDPVVFIEPRWLYSIEQSEPQNHDEASFQDSSTRFGYGDELAIVTYGEGVLDSVLATKNLGSDEISIFDYWNLTPGCHDQLAGQLSEFRQILFIDPYCSSGGPLTELLTNLFFEKNYSGKINFARVPLTPVPTATTLTEEFYLNQNKIASILGQMLNRRAQLPNLTFENIHLPPKTRIGENWEILES